MRIVIKTNLSMCFILTAILCISNGCQDQQIAAEIEKLKDIKQKLEMNKSIVERAHEKVWSKGNISVIDSLYSSGFVAHWITGGDTKLDEFKNLIISTRKSFPGLKEEIIHIITEGDLVVTHFNSSGTMKGDLEGIPATGRFGSRPEIALHRIKNGKIVEQWTVADQLSLLNQLGIKL